MKKIERFSIFLGINVILNIKEFRFFEEALQIISTKYDKKFHYNCRKYSF
jgi:hypothetical protein